VGCLLVSRSEMNGCSTNLRDAYSYLVAGFRSRISKQVIKGSYGMGLVEVDQTGLTPYGSDRRGDGTSLDERDWRMRLAHSTG
jgi:hypothetical protein